MSTPVNLTLIGCGGMARHHARQILQQLDTSRITCVCEPSPEAYQAFAKIFTDAGQPVPTNETDLAKLIDTYLPAAAFIITPHAYHYDQTKLCLEAGLDVLLEKPMVMNAEEAVGLMEVRDR